MVRSSKSVGLTCRRAWSLKFTPRDRWARTRSPNSDVKVYIGAPAGPKAAGSGYVDVDTLISMVSKVQKQYSSFGGVMLWNADTAYSEYTTGSSNQRLTPVDNDRFDLKIKKAITIQGRGPMDSNDNDASDPPSSTIPVATVASDFRDPREKARVKRPYSFTDMQPDKQAPNRPKAPSRVFFIFDTQS